MNHQLNDQPGRQASVEIEETGMASIATALHVCSGILAGRTIQPFI